MLPFAGGPATDLNQLHLTLRLDPLIGKEEFAIYYRPQLNRVRGSVPAAHSVELRTIVNGKLFLPDQGVEPQREVQLIKVRRGTAGKRKHTMYSLDRRGFLCEGRFLRPPCWWRAGARRTW